MVPLSAYFFFLLHINNMYRYLIADTYKLEFNFQLKKIFKIVFLELVILIVMCIFVQRYAMALFVKSQLPLSHLTLDK